jgi:hypothetical protein
MMPEESPPLNVAPLQKSQARLGIIELFQEPILAQRQLPVNHVKREIDEMNCDELSHHPALLNGQPNAHDAFACRCHGI